MQFEQQFSYSNYVVLNAEHSLIEIVQIPLIILYHFIIAFPNENYGYSSILIFYILNIFFNLPEIIAVEPQAEACDFLTIKYLC